MPATFTAICPSWNILRASGDAHCSCRNAATSVPSQMLSMVTPSDQQGARGTSPGFRHRTAFQGTRSMLQRRRDARSGDGRQQRRSEEHTSELQSLMHISYAVFCLKKKKKTNTKITIK